VPQHAPSSLQQVPVSVQQSAMNLTSSIVWDPFGAVLPSTWLQIAVPDAWVRGPRLLIARVGHLDVEVDEAAAPARVVDQDQLQRRLVEGMVGVAGGTLGGLGGGQLRVKRK